MDVKQVAWLGGVLLLMSGLAFAQPVPPALALVPVASLPCASLTGMRTACQVLSRGLVGSRDAATQIAVLQKTVAQAAVRHPAEQFSRTCGHRGRQSLDCGVARLLAGHVGEGMQLLLMHYERSHGNESAGTFAYLGFLLRWPELDTVQRQDWAKDLAGRLIAALPEPAETIRTRAIGLYRTAGEMEKVRELEQR